MSEPTQEDEIKKKRGKELEDAYKEYAGKLDELVKKHAESKSEEKKEPKKDKDDDKKEASADEVPLRSRWANWKNRKGIRMAQSRALSQKRPYSGLYIRSSPEEG